MEMKLRCPACGDTLSSEQESDGLCLACLFELALESPSLLAERDDEAEATLAFPEEGTFVPGSILGERYRVRALLGRGGMGEVWRAVDLKLRVEVALKALRAEMLTDERALESLRQEVRTAREVISPNVCRVFDLVELDGQELVSMEYIDGITLLDILKMRSPLDLTEAREIAAQFLAGLEAIHEAGLVHRDVKPENLMITRSGRVVLMDFGIAKGLAEGKTGTISGTPAYMAPEQGRGEAPNARADVFSAGVVLTEMIAPGGLATFKARQAVWQGIHQERSQLPDSPWAPVIQKAVARTPGERFPTASALARALDEVTLRVERAEDTHPYPGLASFSQDDAEYFFGRELEVEELWRRLQQPRLLGLIGPSGAGKSSFLKAGLLAVTPTGWRAVVATPSTQPYLALARVLASELAGDEAAVQNLLEFEDPDVAVALVTRWRQQHDHALIVLDQFEELFTLNPPEVQEGFADLLGRLALEADVHVLLALRDDFLFYCSAQPPLSPMFFELTPLRPPTGAALRRALVQPALKCGYRFEDDALVDEMVTEVSSERGALPMLAFAAARLWEHRDREEGLLTREAYELIGGVGGALAQHSEKTLETIGQDHVPIVRELFRNLVTSQGTRAARTRDELLSVFGSTADVGAPFAGARQSADQILNTLIDARLLTSYELPTEDDEGSPEQRIEIIHESLLSSWPRLVRWQAQDEEGALLRDQLRQAAQMWEERGQPEDLLWTGTSYNEYQLWRERYAGGLSGAEETFARAMTAKAERRRRQRGMAMATAFALLLAVLTVVGMFWRQAETQALRAEASQLLALGRLEIEHYPTGALAYALASLERADDPQTRLFALEALWRGPTALILSKNLIDAWLPKFSPDGKWLAAIRKYERYFELWPSTGGEPKLVDTGQDTWEPWSTEFASAGDLLVTRSHPSHAVQIWSFPDGRLVRTLPTQGPVDFRLAGHPERVFTFTQQESRIRVEAWPLGAGEPKLYGDFEDPGLGVYSNIKFPWPLDLDRAGTRFAYVPQKEDGSAKEIYLLPTEGIASTSPRLVGRHPNNVKRIAFHPNGAHLASTDDAGEVRFWDLESGSELPQRRLRQPPGMVWDFRFDQTGAQLASSTSVTAVWDLDDPAGAGPTILHQGPLSIARDANFHPQGSWLTTNNSSGRAVWPISRPYPRDLNGNEAAVLDMAFLPDGKSLASTHEDGTLRLWPLSAAEPGSAKVLFQSNGWFMQWVRPGPRGKHILIGEGDGEVWLVPVDGTAPRLLGDLGGNTRDGALGLHAAAALSGNQTHEIRVWDLETGEEQTLDTGDVLHALRRQMLRFTPDGHLISGGRDRIRIWNLADGSFETLSERPGLLDLSADGRLLGAGHVFPGNEEGEQGPAVLYDLEAGTTIQLDSHGPSSFARLDAAGKIVLTQSGPDGLLRVGPVTGEAPHLLVGQAPMYISDISPDGRWVAGVSSDEPTTIRLWPVPDLSQPPLHTLPYDELLAKLRTLTNLRVVKDPGSETGWNWALDPFPGWEEVPTW